MEKSFCAEAARTRGDVVARITSHFQPLHVARNFPSTRKMSRWDATLSSNHLLESRLSIRQGSCVDRVRVIGMPSPVTVLGGLTAIANDWRWFAITWHVLLGASVVLFLAGWRPSVRLFGYLLVVPLLSVSVMAWLSGNPFNGTVFAILPAVLVATAARFPNTVVRLASCARVASGVAFVVLGVTYPHFLQVESWSTYLYASPFGILPCPTLSVLIGSTLIFSNLGSTFWSATLAGAGFLYGVTGVFRLGVLLDSGLLFASGVLAVAVARDAACWRSYRFDGLPAWLSASLASLIHSLMQRKQPLAIARRVEMANKSERERASTGETSCPASHRTA